MFVDMNSYFASCEQQVNFWLRGRPVGVCVYTGKYGCIISPSVEAKKKGVKTGMRLHEAIQLCPDLVPLETHPVRYREFHVKFINVLKKYSDDVVPKSIDEAIVNFKAYGLVYNDLVEVAFKIKQDIKKEVGDWLRCSIGIAPNVFLAKLGSDIKKPDGITVITSENIDSVLEKLKLEDLPGIAEGIGNRLRNAGILTPVALRKADPDSVRKACNSITGLYWHHRLNFSEVDMVSHVYRTMQAMRQISPDQRKSIQGLHDLLYSLCMKLESRLMKQKVFSKQIHFYTQYTTGKQWKQNIHLSGPVQDGNEIYRQIENRITIFEKNNKSDCVINNELVAVGVTVSDFIAEGFVQFSLFDDSLRKTQLRKTVYNIKKKYGSESIIKADQLTDETILKDVIGFGSVKDIHDDLHKI